ncbi:hypothetical protein KTR10_03460 [Candidatus Kaiserbacteria bacterium]|nr:hypothetical protein [Candidatus Kaiserbacteria bacterium]
MKLVRSIAEGSFSELLEQYQDGDVIVANPSMGHGERVDFAPHQEGYVLACEGRRLLLNGMELLYEEEGHCHVGREQNLLGFLTYEATETGRRCLLNGKLLYEGPGQCIPHPQGILVISTNEVHLVTPNGNRLLTSKYDERHHLAPAYDGCIIIDYDESGKVWLNDGYIFTLPETFSFGGDEWYRPDLEDDGIFGYKDGIILHCDTGDVVVMDFTGGLKHSFNSQAYTEGGDVMFHPELGVISAEEIKLNDREYAIRFSIMGVPFNTVSGCTWSDPLGLHPMGVFVSRYEHQELLFIPFPK